MAVRLYTGVCEETWNKHEVQPGAWSCVSPVYGKTEKTKRVNRVVLPSDTRVIQDSGAFSDSNNQRIGFDEALERQRVHAETFGYSEQVTHTASYDWLIDETWINGKRSKKRWTLQDAETAVNNTIKAARYIAHHNEHNILSAQGVTPQQYLACATQVMQYLDPDNDVLGLGGWCIVGIHKSLMSSFVQTINLVIPEASRRGVKRVHIWGVIYAPAIARLAWLCDQYNIELSTDSVGVQLRPVFGLWGYDNWIDYSYKKPSVDVMGLYRAKHVQLTRSWLQTVQTWRQYRESDSVYIPDKQMQPALF